MKSKPGRVEGWRTAMRFLVATLLATVIGIAMTVIARFALSYPSQESMAIGVLGGMGAAICVLHFQ